MADPTGGGNVGELRATATIDASLARSTLAGLRSDIDAFAGTLGGAAQPAIDRFSKGLGLLERRDASMAMRELRSGVATLAAESIGASGPIERLGLSFLSFGVGSSWMLAIIGGIAAVALAMKALGDDAQALEQAVTDTGKAAQAAFVHIVDTRNAKDADDIRAHLSALAAEIVSLHTKQTALRTATGWGAMQVTELDKVNTALVPLVAEYHEFLAVLQSMDAHKNKAAEDAAAQVTAANSIRSTDAATQSLQESVVRLTAATEHWNPVQLATALANVKTGFEDVDDATRALIVHNAELAAQNALNTKAATDLSAMNEQLAEARLRLAALDQVGGESSAAGPIALIKALHDGFSPAQAAAIAAVAAQLAEVNRQLAAGKKAAEGEEGAIVSLFETWEQRAKKIATALQGDVGKAMADFVTGAVDMATKSKGAFQDLGGVFESSIAMVTKNLGTLLVNEGIAAIGQGILGKAIQSMMSWNPAGAIAAGAVLIALGTKLGAMASADVSSTGAAIASGTTVSSSSSAAGIGTQTPAPGTIVLKLQGDHLVGMIFNDPRNQQALAKAMIDMAGRNVRIVPA